MIDKIKDIRKKFFFMADNEIFDMELSPYSLSVYCYILRCAGNKEKAFPSIARISEITKMSRPKAISSIKELIEKNIIKKAIVKLDSGNYSRNEYYLIDVSAWVFPGGSKPDLPVVVNEVNRGSKPDLPGVVNEVNTKNKHIKNTNKEYTSDFLNWFNSYPKEKDNTKASAFKWWQKRKKPEKENIIIATRFYSKEIKDKKTKNGYIIAARNFIGRDERYLDYVELGKEFEERNKSHEYRKKIERMYYREIADDVYRGISKANSIDFYEKKYEEEMEKNENFKK